MGDKSWHFQTLPPIVMAYAENHFTTFVRFIYFRLTSEILNRILDIYITLVVLTSHRCIAMIQLSKQKTVIDRE